MENWLFLEIVEEYSPFLLDFGSKRLGQIEVNSTPNELLFHPGMEVDLKPFLHLGKNKINISDEEIIRKFNPRLCLGKELKSWEIKKGKSSWRKIECAFNLQVLEIVPKNYVGEITYRTLLKSTDFLGNNPTLFFEGVDGEADIRLNSVSLMRRGANHWEDSFEIPLNDFSNYSGSLEITLHIINKVGLCGLTNWVHLGETIYLKHPLTTININENQQELQLLRCGEGRVRAFLCDSSPKVIRYWLAGSSSQPALVDTNQDNITWLVLNSFNSSIRLYQPKIAPLITAGFKRISFKKLNFGSKKT